MSQEDIFINGELLRLRREARGWVLSDLATRACMSVKQIRQLEEGGMSAFYSAAVKATSAKKVGALLGLTPEEIFSQKTKPEHSIAMFESEVSDQISKDSASEVHVSIQEVTQQEELRHDIEGEASVSDEAADAVKPKTSIWIIASLFLAALAVAAYMQPKEELAQEVAPPLQTLPADAAETASSASASDVSADATAATNSAATTQIPKSASTASGVASSVQPVASLASTTRP